MSSLPTSSLPTQKDTLPTKVDIDEMGTDKIVWRWLDVVAEHLGPCPTGQKYIGDEQYYQFFCHLISRIQSNIRGQVDLLDNASLQKIAEVTRAVSQHYGEHGTLWKTNIEKFWQLRAIAEYFGFGLLEKAAA